MKLPLNFQQLMLIRKLADDMAARMEQRPDDAELFKAEIATCREVIHIIDHST